MLLDQVYTKIMALFNFNKAVVNTGAKKYVLRVHYENIDAISKDFVPGSFDDAEFTAVSDFKKTRRDGEKSLRYDADYGYIETLRAVSMQNRITLRSGAVTNTDTVLLRMLTNILRIQICYISEDNGVTFLPVYYDGTEIKFPAPGMFEEYELPFVYAQIEMSDEA